jgi:hypothetical protein
MGGMIKRILTYIVFLVSGGFVLQGQSDRWKLTNNGSIEWTIDKRLPHDDHLEMSGQQLSVVLRYGVAADSSFHINRALVFPMLRLHPVTRTQAHLRQRVSLDIARLITVAEMTPRHERVQKITFNGLLKVESLFDFMSGRKVIKNGLKLTRLHYPSTTSSYYIEEYAFENASSENITLRLPDLNMSYPVPVEQGLYGAYRVDVKLSKTGWFELKSGETLSFYALFAGQKADEVALQEIPVDDERDARETLIKQWWSNLVLETPDTVLNGMFAFAKLRGAESIYKTKGGFMHGPGGEAYYAAIWANDQAEYINPFFPFLGYDIGNESAINSFRHFARYMNDEYKPIPSSIISEGAHYWHGAKDRGDGAMIAYGAARFALALGNREGARKLWDLITWTLEFCRRKVNGNGVVSSDSDELENRFPAGDANLCTSSLYYDALISAIYLGKDLEKPRKQLDEYRDQAETLRRNIEKHFGSTVEGFDTYRYYEGNTILRSWICIPLTMGIYDRAEGTVAALFSCRLWTDNGLLTQAGTETFWDRTTLYALRGIFAAGETEKGLAFLKHYSRRRLLGEHVPYAIEAWPEGSQRHLSAESGLYCRIYTEGVFGIRPTGLNSFDLTPHLPDEWDFMNLRSIKAFNRNFDISITREDRKLEVIVQNDQGVMLKKMINKGETIQVKFK